VQDIIRDILNGNQESFRVIVQQFSPDLLRLAFHFVRDWDEAQDLTQNTLIRCFQNLRRYDPQRPFRPWLYRIHLNVCKAAAKRRRGRRSREIRYSETDREPSSEIGVDDAPLILQQIERLSVKQKAAFILVEIEGMNSKEAAYALKCSDSTLRVHLARAKQTLRENLTRLGIGYGSIC
jgi:RNA polymerase sigma factor (sigma-70 family)